MKQCNPFNAFLENEDAKQRVLSWLNTGRLPHAVLLTAEDGCGRNFFARLLAQAYLDDNNGLVARNIHPDCLLLEGEGASGNIPVKRMRELSYALNMSAVSADGVRVAILKNVKNLNHHSANALLKILEEPPAGIMFILTAANTDDVIATIRSRCVAVPLLPLRTQTCMDYVRQQHQDYDQKRVQEICALYAGRLGFVVRALASPERLALIDCAKRFCVAAAQADKLIMASELDCVSSRDDMKNLLFDITMRLKQILKDNTNTITYVNKTALAVFGAMRDLEKYVNIRLVATQLVAQL